MEKYDRAMDDLFSTPALEASLHQEDRKKINNLIDDMLRSMLLARSAAATQIKENVEEINEDYNDVAELNSHCSKNEEQQEENSSVFASSLPENIYIISSFQQNNQDKAFKQVTGKSAARSAYVNESTTKSQDSEAKSDITKDHKPENIGEKNDSDSSYSNNQEKDFIESCAQSQYSEAKSDTTKDHKPENIGEKNDSGHNYSSNSKKSDGASINYSKPDFYKCLDVISDLFDILHRDPQLKEECDKLLGNLLEFVLLSMSPGPVVMDLKKMSGYYNDAIEFVNKYQLNINVHDTSAFEARETVTLTSQGVSSAPKVDSEPVSNEASAADETVSKERETVTLTSQGVSSATKVDSEPVSNEASAADETVSKERETVTLTSQDVSSAPKVDSEPVSNEASAADESVAEAREAVVFAHSEIASIDKHSLGLSH